MTGFEPRTSGIVSDRSTNLATATALLIPFNVFQSVINIIYIKSTAGTLLV